MNFIISIKNGISFSLFGGFTSYVKDQKEKQNNCLFSIPKEIKVLRGLAFLLEKSWKEYDTNP
jgi:hypothetical protein